MYDSDYYNYLAKWWGPFLSASKLLSVLLQRLACIYISDAIGCHSDTQLKIGTGSPHRGQNYIQLMPPLLFYFNINMQSMEIPKTQEIEIVPKIIEECHPLTIQHQGSQVCCSSKSTKSNCKIQFNFYLNNPYRKITGSM